MGYLYHKRPHQFLLCKPDQVRDPRTGLATTPTGSQLTRLCILFILFVTLTTLPFPSDVFNHLFSHC